MSCKSCERNVETALNNLDEVTRVTTDHEGSTVEIVVEDDVTDQNLHTTIANAGYDVTD